MKLKVIYIYIISLTILCLTKKNEAKSYLHLHYFTDDFMFKIFFMFDKKNEAKSYLHLHYIYITSKCFIIRC